MQRGAGHDPLTGILVDERLADDECCELFVLADQAFWMHFRPRLSTASLNIPFRTSDAIWMIGVVHIHKTAGTTLASVFKASFGTRHCDVLSLDPGSPHLTPDQLRRMMDRWYPRLDSALGHSLRIYAGLESVVGDIQWVTFLRDPLERTASHYQYDVQRGDVDLDFDEWITHDVVRDRQTRILAGPEATSREAIDLLGRFSFVGRPDRFDESLVLMQERLGVPDIRYASKWTAPSNDIKKRLLADPATRRQLESANRNDVAVWEHAVAEVFPKQLAEYGPGVADAVAAFRERNSHMTRRRQYARPKYPAYVAKWRLGYRPWVRRVTGDPTAG